MGSGRSGNARIGSLFSGIGGLELGLERAGVGTVSWQVEIDSFRRRVLARHWPNAERFEDVRTVGREQLSPVYAICGGFPCQDLSTASRGRCEGLDGKRSGLWREYARIVGELRPTLVFVENVANYAARKWLCSVRDDLHQLGYRTRAIRVDARDLGAPHYRARIIVVGHAHPQGEPTGPQYAKVARLPPSAGFGGHWRHPFAGPVRVAHGVPTELDRVHALGDAVVPDVAELVGRLALEWAA